MQEFNNNVYYKPGNNVYVEENVYNQDRLNDIDVSQYYDSYRESLQYLECLLNSIDLRKRIYQNMYNYLNGYYYNE